MLLHLQLPAVHRIFLLFLLCFFVNSQAKGQSITLTVKNEPIDKVFLLLEKQSGFNFLYSREILAGSKPVSFTVQNEPFSSVIANYFNDQPLELKIIDQHVVVKSRPRPPAQKRRPLRGKITNEAGEAMNGLTVAIRNSSLITATDSQGEFQFDDVPAGALLLISGAEIEPIEVASRDMDYVIANVKLRMTALDETMVIAYGKTTRRFSTGTVTSIKAEEIARQPVSNLLSTLSGRVAGLQVTQSSGVPGSNMVVRLRGRNSIANGNDPLFIVDGVPFPSTTLTGVFGGAAGTSSSPLDNINPSDIESIEVLKDAAATAIYGSRGANGVILITTKKGKPGKTAFAVNFYTGAGEVTRSMKLLSTPDYLRMRREAFANDGATPTLTNAADLVLWDTTRYTDWQALMIGGTMHITDLNTSLSGGTERTQFLFSSGYHKETTVFPGNFYAEKFSGAMQVNHVSPDQKLSINFSSSFLLNNNILPQQDPMNFINLSPNAPAIYTNDGKFNWEQSTWLNPIAATQRVFRNNSENFIFNLSATYRLPLNFSLRLSSGYNRIRLKEHSTNPLFTQNPLSAALNASANFGDRAQRTIIHEPQLLYTLTWKDWQYDAVVGASLQQGEQESLYLSGAGYTSDQLLRSIRGAGTVTASAEDHIKYRYAGLFGRLNIDFRKTYLLSLAARRDGSSRYGPANRFSNFGSVGFAWIFSKEKFLASNSWVSFGKLKLSAGVTGNDQIGDYRYLDLYSTYLYPYQGVSVYTPTQLFNPDFGWERVRKLEAGLDLGFFKDRIIIGANYYHNTTTNQLLTYALPTLSGFTGVIRNVPATIRNTGIELELSSDIIRTAKLRWNASLNMTIPYNRLIAFEGLARSTYANLLVIGQPLSIVKRYFSTGVNPATGIYTFSDFNNDGRINSLGDLQFLQNTAQSFFGGFQSKLEYKSFAATVLFQVVGQPAVIGYLNRFSRPGSMSNQPEEVLQRWQKPGDISNIERFGFSAGDANDAFSNYRQSDQLYTNASFVRMKNVTLSYDFISSNSRIKFIKNGRFTLQGQNLLTLTQYKGFDPETVNSLPPLAVVTAGFQITF